MIKDERHSSGCNALTRARAAYALVHLLIIFGVTETFAQPRSRGQQPAKIRGHAEELLGKFWEIITGSFDSGPPPSRDDLESIKRAFCKLLPDNCSGFPSSGTRVYRYGGIYFFPHLNSSAMFYNHEKSEAVSLPPGVCIGVMKAITHLESKGWSAAKISAWLLPIAPYYSSRMLNNGDCYIYESQNGYVRIKKEGNSSSGRWLSVKIIAEKPIFEAHTRPEDLRGTSAVPPLRSLMPCSRFEKYQAYWGETFDL